MASYGTRHTASDRWWQDYTLGQMGVRTGSIASEFGIQHRRPLAWENQARLIVRKEPSAAAPVQIVPAATARGDPKFLGQVGNVLLYVFGLLGLAEAVVSDPSYLISFAAIGGAIALYQRHRR